MLVDPHHTPSHIGTGDQVLSYHASLQPFALFSDSPCTQGPPHPKWVQQLNLYVYSEEQSPQVPHTHYVEACDGGGYDTDNHMTHEPMTYIKKIDSDGESVSTDDSRLQVTYNDSWEPDDGDLYGNRTQDTDDELDDDEQDEDDLEEDDADAVDPDDDGKDTDDSDEEEPQEHDPNEDPEVAMMHNRVPWVDHLRDWVTTPPSIPLGVPVPEWNLTCMCPFLHDTSHLEGFTFHQN